MASFPSVPLPARTSAKNALLLSISFFALSWILRVVDELAERALLVLDGFEHVVDAARDGIHAIIHFVVRSPACPSVPFPGLDVGHHAVEIPERTVEVIVGVLVHHEFAQRAAPVAHIRQHVAGLFRDRAQVRPSGRRCARRPPSGPSLPGRVISSSFCRTRPTNPRSMST